jgi:hypothetical protein
LQQWSGVNAVSFFAPQIFSGPRNLKENILSDCHHIKDGAVLQLLVGPERKRKEMFLCQCAGVSAFSRGGNEGQLYAALLVNGVQWIFTIVTVICVDKASLRRNDDNEAFIP